MNGENPDRFTKIRDYRTSYGWRFWKRLRPSKCDRELKNYRFLQEHGIPCPREIKASSKRNLLGLLTYAELSMERLENATDLRYLMCLNEYADWRADWRFRRKLAQTLGCWVRRMHELEFFHLNLNFRNILVDKTQRDPPKVYFIDLTACKIHPTPAARRRYCQVKDLAFLYREARKWCRHSEILSFSKAYLGRDRLTDADRELEQHIRIYAENKWTIPPPRH